MNHQEELAYVLKTIGIETETLEAEHMLFAMELNHERTILRFKADCLVNIATHPALRQAVITVREPAREVPESVTVCCPYSLQNHSREEILANDWTSLLEDGVHSNLNLPLGSEVASITVTDVQDFTQDVYVPPGRGRYLDLDVMYSVPESHDSYLVGYDEDHLFISRLPVICSTVSEAHEALRPPGLPPNALRQGEWFFIPVEGDYLPDPSFYYYVTDLSDLVGEDRESGHCAYFIYELDDDTYLVRGYIMHERHKPLWLPNWCRVVRNLELEATGDLWD